MAAPYAKIHHFEFNPAKGEASYDEDGEPLFGYYYEICDSDGNGISQMFGPYGTKAEVEAACHMAWDTDSYDKPN